MSEVYPDREATNQSKLARAHEIIRSFEAEICKRGWFGEVVVTLKVQDGVVQHVDGKQIKAVR